MIFSPLAQAINRNTIVIFLAFLILLYGVGQGITNVELQRAITQEVEKTRKEAPYYDPHALSIAIFSNNAMIFVMTIAYSIRSHQNLRKSKFER